MIQVTPDIAIDEREIHEDFIRSSGPGGQNVNKVATAVQLRFDVARSTSLSDDVRQRLFSLARKRITDDGVLIIEARRHRTQGANRLDAVERLVELIRKAALKPTPRRKTRPTLGSKTRRLESKRRRGQVKQTRGRVEGNAD
ncbi:MAG: alternative ribosome rescue aminoacyl-tRNA hydrolase ArfB [Dehalococcoidia bacterium]|nr:alternative ribosome rescue aminoacyl-tRNA hydrolase ArfB [Dehalococcoidia bacterium]